LLSGEQTENGDVIFRLDGKCDALRSVFVGYVRNCVMSRHNLVRRDAVAYLMTLLNCERNN